jgi:hypothetical protein
LRRLVVGPDRIAEHVLASIERGGGETSVPRYYGAAGMIQNVAPNLFARVLARSRSRTTIDPR